MGAMQHTFVHFRTLSWFCSCLLPEDCESSPVRSVSFLKKKLLKKCMRLVLPGSFVSSSTWICLQGIATFGAIQILRSASSFLQSFAGCWDVLYTSPARTGALQHTCRSQRPSRHRLLLEIEAMYTM